MTVSGAMEHSGVFRSGERGIPDPYLSTDLRCDDLPREDRHPVDEKQYRWRMEDGAPIELKVEHFHFHQELYKNYRRYTLTIGGVVIPVIHVKNYYARDGRIAPEKVILQAAEGELVMSHVRIRNEEGGDTHRFRDSATWCERQLTLGE